MFIARKFTYRNKKEIMIRPSAFAPFRIMIYCYRQQAEKAFFPCGPFALLTGSLSRKKNGPVNRHFQAGKVKTDFQLINPTWEQIKIMSDIIQNMSDIF